MTDALRAWIGPVGLLLLAGLLCGGCLTRRILIDTVPGGAEVVVNQRNMGPGPVVIETADFGDLDLRVEAAGYQPQWLTLPHPRPWWGYDPLLFLVEICPYPFQIDRTFRVQLEPQPRIDTKLLKQHADEAALQKPPEP